MRVRLSELRAKNSVKRTCSVAIAKILFAPFKLLKISLVMRKLVHIPPQQNRKPLEPIVNGSLKFGSKLHLGKHLPFRIALFLLAISLPSLVEISRNTHSHIHLAPRPGHTQKMAHAYHRFWKWYKNHRFSSLWQGAETLAPATQNDVWTSKSGPNVWCL